MKVRAETKEIEEAVENEILIPDPEKSVAMEIIDDNTRTDGDDPEDSEPCVP